MTSLLFGFDCRACGSFLNVVQPQTFLKKLKPASGGPENIPKVAVTEKDLIKEYLAMAQNYPPPKWMVLLLNMIISVGHWHHSFEPNPFKIHIEKIGKQSRSGSDCIDWWVSWFTHVCVCVPHISVAAGSGD